MKCLIPAAFACLVMLLRVQAEPQSSANQTTLLTELTERRLEHFRADNESLPIVLQALGRACGFPILCDADVSGTVSLEMADASPTAVLSALLSPGGQGFEVCDGWVQVHRFDNRFYTFDYPQVTRTGSSSSTISMGGQNSSGYGNNNALQGVATIPLTPTGLRDQSQGMRGQDTTQIQIEQKSDGDFWQSIETQMKAMLVEGESMLLNRFSGVVHVRAGRRTHEQIREFVTLVNRRVGAQVEIVAKIVEVRLSSEKKLGIDWNAAAFSIGNHVRVGSPVVPPGEATALSGLTGPLNVREAGGFQFAPDTFTGTVSSGKVDVVIRALEEQGDVSVTSQPRLRLLNNQTGYIKDATDRPFFRLVSNVTINAGGLPSAGAQPITQTQYQTQTISIGTVLPVTAQVSADGEITLDVTPALTRLREVVTSPDRLQTAPVLEVKQTSTIVRVRSGQSAIIGGLITDSEAASQRAVPGLSKVPGLGRLFRSDGKTKSRSELVIILTPTVVQN
ncbi:secretin N-terminal domain-containing protein [Nibricoccus sp. IMCC34717]|uniref:secretin N-terminal domain-containing protein n=1 Tax=Nibricoccus sp. IMCC34717 TaxID=3034021 RepID=UPI00385094F5